MLIDHPNRDAILAASVQLEVVLDVIKRITLAQTEVQDLVTAGEQAIHKLRVLNDKSFAGNANNKRLLEQFNAELARLDGSIGFPAPGKCRCCGKPIVESEDQDCCSACVYRLIPLYADLGRGFDIYAI
eukprot:TRINITY_DN42612_c0_g1_i1.p1 TRINITY_DN42612_c0_g1~~TRINITY_DN42612_c0_g1_i1.p1  ORF type:complete len:129 (+),score=9.90 TRINITY_DN42612_c0_g1_i1:201-587(+)